MTFFLRCFLLAFLLLTSCRREVPMPPRIEAYVWQSTERAEVRDAMVQSRGLVKTLHVRAAELRWTGKAFQIERTVTKSLPEKGCGLVIRIGSSASALEWTPDQIQPVAQVVKQLAALRPSEIQCDYDSPQKRLDLYSRLLTALQSAAGDIPVVPTTLASWLDEPAFKTLVKDRPGYVLQVHSLQLPKDASQPVVIFNPETARLAVEKASKLGVPFRVAMATYGCEVWFDDKGKVIEVISEDRAPEGLMPATRQFALADPSVSARLVASWNASPPRGLEAVIWYRLPTARDRRNWPWLAFQDVVLGEDQPPVMDLEGTGTSDTRDLFVVNRGAFPSRLPASISVSNPTVAADGGGAYRLEIHDGGLRFVLRDDVWPWLDPGQKIPAGWMRVHESGSRIHFTFAP